MRKFMNNYYEQIKDNIGISDKYKKSLGEDYGLDQIIEKMRPNTTVENFRSFLKEYKFQTKECKLISKSF